MRIVLGDARLTLANADDGAFDVLALDAFSGDAIPLHVEFKSNPALIAAWEASTDGGATWTPFGGAYVATAHGDLTFPILMNIFDGVKTVNDLAAALSRMSMVNQNLLGRPTTPMLILAGVSDTQVPISDIYLLLSSGDVPKDAWINPKGGHLGRQVKVWPDPRIFKEVIIPWLVHTLGAQAEKAAL